MSYTINKSDGSLLVILPDGEVDENTTSVALIGRNVNAYGEYYNENLVVMLENFATNGVAPNAPLVGQLWYDTSDGRLKIYTPSEIFSPIGIATVSPSQPTSPNAGDLWIDSTNNQLNFSENGISFVTVGPFNSSNATNKTGWYSENIGTGTFAVLYNKDKVVAIASSSTVSFGTTFDGMTGVTAGINLNTSIPGIRFVGTATNSIYADGIGTWTNTFVEKAPGIGVNQLVNSSLTVTQIVRVGQSVSAGTGYPANNGSVVITANGAVTVASDSGIYMGVSGVLRVWVDNLSPAVVKFESQASNGPQEFYLTGPYGLVPAVKMNPSDGGVHTIKFFDTIQTSTVFVGQNLVVSNNVTATNLAVNSGIISLVTSSTNNKGITLGTLGTYSFLWKDATNSWTSSNNIDLSTSTATYKIAGIDVISQTALAPAITSAPGLTTIGSLTTLTVGLINVASNVIATTATGVDLILDALGTGTVNVNYNKITNLSTCTLDLDAANKRYVDSQVTSLSNAIRQITFNVDITGINNTYLNNFLIDYLNTLAPPNNPGEPEYNLSSGTRARLLCTSVQSTTPPSILWLDKSVNTSTGYLTDVAGTSTTASFILNTISITRTAREYRINSANSWTFVSTITLPTGIYT